MSLDAFTNPLSDPASFAANRSGLDAPGAASYALVPGLRYRVYYLPSDHKLVSIEPLA